MGREDNKESKGFFGKLFKKIDESLETGRSKISAEGTSTQSKNAESTSVVSSPSKKQEGSTSTVYLSREIRTDKPQKIGANLMVIPDGVEIVGNITGKCDAQIYGKINGDIVIEGKLEIGPSASVKSKIRAVSAYIHGNIEGEIECDEDVEIGEKSRVTADITAVQRVIISGTVKGNIKAGSLVKLLSTAKVDGDITVVKSLSIDENAVFNGRCIRGKPENIKLTPIANSTPKSSSQNVSAQQVKK